MSTSRLASEKGEVEVPLMAMKEADDGDEDADQDVIITNGKKHEWSFLASHRKRMLLIGGRREWNNDADGRCARLCRPLICVPLVLVLLISFALILFVIIPNYNSDNYERMWTSSHCLGGMSMMLDLCECLETLYDDMKRVHEITNYKTPFLRQFELMDCLHSCVNDMDES